MSCACPTYQAAMTAALADQRAALDAVLAEHGKHDEDVIGVRASKIRALIAATRRVESAESERDKAKDVLARAMRYLRGEPTPDDVAHSLDAIVAFFAAVEKKLAATRRAFKGPDNRCVPGCVRLGCTPDVTCLVLDA